MRIKLTPKQLATRSSELAAALRALRQAEVENAVIRKVLKEKEGDLSQEVWRLQQVVETGTEEIPDSMAPQSRDTKPPADDVMAEASRVGTLVYQERLKRVGIEEIRRVGSEAGKRGGRGNRKKPPNG